MFEGGAVGQIWPAPVVFIGSITTGPGDRPVPGAAPLGDADVVRP